MMHSHLPILALTSLVLGSLPAFAQQPSSNKFRPQLKPRPGLDSKTANTGILKKREPIGARYRLDMSFVPGNINDGDTKNPDHIYEAYGTLKINGETWWEMPRRTSNRGAQQMGGYFVPNNATIKEKATQYGYSLTKNNAFNNGRKFEFDAYNGDPKSILKLSLRLYDADTAPDSKDLSQDDTFGKYDETLDLLKMNGGDYYWFWKDGNGNDSDFYLHIEKVRDLYEKPGNGLPGVHNKPVITKPHFPGKIPGPGPVTKTAPIRR